MELLDYFSDQPQQPITAVPGKGLNVPIWILGSSLYGAQVAAMLGLPYSFASHFAPAQLNDAIRVYRENFQPSKYLDIHYVMICYFVIVYVTDKQASHHT